MEECEAVMKAELRTAHSECNVSAGRAVLYCGYFQLYPAGIAFFKVRRCIFLNSLFQKAWTVVKEEKKFPSAPTAKQRQDVASAFYNLYALLSGGIHMPIIDVNGIALNPARLGGAGNVALMKIVCKKGNIVCYDA
jgi:hypothetical protein